MAPRISVHQHPSEYHIATAVPRARRWFALALLAPWALAVAIGTQGCPEPRPASTAPAAGSEGEVPAVPATSDTTAPPEARPAPAGDPAPAVAGDVAAPAAAPKDERLLELRAIPDAALCTFEPCTDGAACCGSCMEVASWKTADGREVAFKGTTMPFVVAHDGVDSCGRVTDTFRILVGGEGDARTVERLLVFPPDVEPFVPPRWEALRAVVDRCTGEECPKDDPCCRSCTSDDLVTASGVAVDLPEALKWKVGDLSLTNCGTFRSPAWVAGELEGNRLKAKVLSLTPDSP